jgi:hypothetical protein
MRTRVKKRLNGPPDGLKVISMRDQSIQQTEVVFEEPSTSQLKRSNFLIHIQNNEKFKS